MAAIQERGRLIVGVDQNTKPFGFLDPGSVGLQGFDIDLAREIARAIFGDPDRIDLQVVEANQREPALESGQVDLVVRTFSITCKRKRTSTSPPRTSTPSRRSLRERTLELALLLTFPASGCVRFSGTTSLQRVFELNPGPP
jgi:polar amino acid transport system substrate-binding protein